MSPKLQLYWPLHPFAVSQRFGERLAVDYSRFGLAGHNGLDIVRPQEVTSGSNVRAAHDGVVTYAGYEKNEGAGVVVRTLVPFDYNGQPTYFKTIYWHLQPEIFCRVGQVVDVGDILARADNTGFSTGPHLHFGLKPIKQGENEWAWENIEQNNGYRGAVDPTPFLGPDSAYSHITFIEKLLSSQ